MPSRFAVLLMCLPMASCDVFYGVKRRAEAPVSFDPVAAEQFLRLQPGFDPVDAVAWDGRALWCPFRRDGAVAGFGYSPLEEYGGSGITVESLWVGHPPDPALLRRSMQLQDELLRVLSEHLQEFPSMSSFSTEWVNMEAQPQQPTIALMRAIAAERPNRWLDQFGVHVKATICVDIESEDEMGEVEKWFLAWCDKLSFVSEDNGCGCCVRIWNVEGPPEAIAAIPASRRSAD